MRIKFPAILLAGIFFISGAVFGADGVNLYERFEGKRVKVFMSPIKDSTANRKVDPVILKTRLEEALKARKSTKFVVVQTAQEAELSIDADIKDFWWTDHDPVDMITGLSGAAADAVIVEDYARLQVDVKVTEVSKNRIIWQDRVMATVTKKPMSEAESLPLIMDDFANTFIRQCFGRKKAR